MEMSYAFGVMYTKYTIMRCSRMLPLTCTYTTVKDSYSKLAYNEFTFTAKWFSFPVDLKYNIKL